MAELPASVSGWVVTAVYPYLVPGKIPYPLQPWLSSIRMYLAFCRASFAALAQQSSGPTFGSLAHQGGAFGSPQPTGGFGGFASNTSKLGHIFTLSLIK